MTDNKYNPAKRKFFFGWLCGHHKDNHWPMAGKTRTATDGTTYEMQDDGSVRKLCVNRGVQR